MSSRPLCLKALIMKAFALHLLVTRQSGKFARMITNTLTTKAAKMVIYQVAQRNPPHFRKVPPNFENMFFQVEYLLGFSICLRRLKQTRHHQCTQLNVIYIRFLPSTEDLLYRLSNCRLNSFCFIFWHLVLAWMVAKSYTFQ